MTQIIEELSYRLLKEVSNLSYIFAILVSPLPFLKLMRVVEACARMCPPIGFLGSAWKLRNDQILVSIFLAYNRNLQ